MEEASGRNEQVVSSIEKKTKRYGNSVRHEYLGVLWVQSNWVLHHMRQRCKGGDRGLAVGTAHTVHRAALYQHTTIKTYTQTVITSYYFLLPITNNFSSKYYTNTT